MSKLPNYVDNNAIIYYLAYRELMVSVAWLIAMYGRGYGRGPVKDTLELMNSN